MITDWIKERMSEKWGEFDGHPAYLEDVNFNYFFCPIAMEKYDAISSPRGFSFPDELLEIYSVTNGMRLCLSSFCIYGIQHGEDEVEPYDLCVENYNIHARMKENDCEDKNLFFFGSFGRNYVFAFRTSGKKTFYLMENGSDKEIAIFESIGEIVKRFIPSMIDNYDEQYYKHNPIKKYTGIPSLENMVLNLSEVGM